MSTKDAIVIIVKLLDSIHWPVLAKLPHSQGLSHAADRRDC